MTICDTAGSTTFELATGERRSELRNPVSCDLWMIDHEGSTVLRCRCLDSSPSGMRLRVPLGYGVAEGQRYELRSHLPGERPSIGFGVVGSRWITVARTQLILEEDRLEIGVTLDPAESVLSWTARPADIKPVNQVS
jgi:hypothetical protein